MTVVYLFTVIDMRKLLPESLFTSNVNDYRRVMSTIFVGVIYYSR